MGLHKIHVPKGEFWDERKREFVYTKETTLKLEHSLISIAKWESKWHIPYLSSEKTNEQALDYVRCMTLNPDVDPNVYLRLTVDDIKELKEYIEDPMTATTIKDDGSKHGNGQIITAELVYYWMTQFNIPIEFEKWHFNRLITLIRVCAEESNPNKKMSKAEAAKSMREINAARRAKYNTKG